MRHKRYVPIIFLAAGAMWVGPLVSGSEAAPHSLYAYRPYSYRAIYTGPYRHARYYSHRPYYRYYRTYRPYYGYGLYYHPYSYWSWPWFRPSFGMHFGYVAAARYYGGGAADYAYQNGAVQTKVEPRETEVYVDGHYAGIVDDFDGMFQRLYLPPGEHEILLRLDGHQTYRQNLLINSGRTYKIHHEMRPLGPGESTEPPPKPEGQVYVDRYPGETPRPGERPHPGEETQAPRPREPSRQESERSSAPSRFGMLSLRVQPPEAQIFIDGELWGTAEGFEELVIHLLAGPHQIEIRLEGYAPFASDVDIREGRATSLNVKLNGFRL